MTTYYYRKRNLVRLKKIIHGIGLSLFCVGILGLVYVFYPLVAWELYLAPAFASQAIAAPIPSKEILTSPTLLALLKNSLNSKLDSSNAADWYPDYVPQGHQATGVTTYYLSIPTLGISNATVTNADNDLDHHLVNYSGTAIPPENGTTVDFGHSTLEQWFDPHNYKAIFATLINIKIGDKIIATVNGADYTYFVDKITVVDPENTTPLQQQYDDSYLTLITCTPPGTTLARLVVHSHLAKLANSSLQ